MTVSEGDSIFLTCVSYGVPYSAITWRKEGAELDNSSRISIYNSPVIEQDLTFTQSILEICSSQLSDDGMYQCVAENGASNDSVTFSISVAPVGGRSEEQLLLLVVGSLGISHEFSGILIVDFDFACICKVEENF